MPGEAWDEGGAAANGRGGGEGGDLVAGVDGPEEREHHVVRQTGVTCPFLPQAVQEASFHLMAQEALLWPFLPHRRQRSRHSGGTGGQPAPAPPLEAEGGLRRGGE